MRRTPRDSGFLYTLSMLAMIGHPGFGSLSADFHQSYALDAFLCSV